MKKNRMLYYILVISFGLFVFVYGGIDDSPGGQMIGLIMAIVGAAGVIKWLRKRKNENAQNMF